MCTDHPQRILVAGLLALLIIPGCVWIFQTPEIREVQRPQADTSTVVVESPVRVHLPSGRVALFPEGVQFTADAVRAGSRPGRLYDLDFEPLGPVDTLPMDSIVAAETYDTGYDEETSFLVSILATVGTVAAAPALAVAIFGSCPTVYSDGPDGPVLEAESFPNSIVSLFELRDVDPLRVQAGPDGTVELEVRNEALETHYINHLELIEVAHAEAATALPAPDGQAFVLRDHAAPIRATDRAGRDVRAPLMDADEQVFSTDPQTLAAATPNDLMDHIDLTFPAPATDTAAVVLRLRNSLLNTVYFYDVMLAGQGPRALDWLGRDLASLSYAVGLGDFYAQHMGLRIQVWDGTAYRPVGKVGEVGPIAWDDVAVPLAVPATDSLRLRLHFVADAWRIDAVALAEQVKTVTPRGVPLHAIEASADVVPDDPLALTAAPDEDYLTTMPGTRFWVRFQVGPEPVEGRRTFFLAAQGYYTEWMRRDWLAPPAAGTSFKPSVATLHTAMQRWQRVKPTFEAQFETSKIPVR
jgi:hypothetical protein